MNRYTNEDNHGIPGEGSHVQRTHDVVRPVTRGKGNETCSPENSTFVVYSARSSFENEEDRLRHTAHEEMLLEYRRLLQRQRGNQRHIAEAETELAQQQSLMEEYYAEIDQYSREYIRVTGEHASAARKHAQFKHERDRLKQKKIAQDLSSMMLRDEAGDIMERIIEVTDDIADITKLLQMGADNVEAEIQIYQEKQRELELQCAIVDADIDRLKTEYNDKKLDLLDQGIMYISKRFVKQVPDATRSVSPTPEAKDASPIASPVFQPDRPPDVPRLDLSGLDSDESSDGDKADSATSSDESGSDISVFDRPENPMKPDLEMNSTSNHSPIIPKLLLTQQKEELNTESGIVVDSQVNGANIGDHAVEMITKENLQLRLYEKDDENHDADLVHGKKTPCLDAGDFSEYNTRANGPGINHQCIEVRPVLTLLDNLKPGTASDVGDNLRDFQQNGNTEKGGNNDPPNDAFTLERESTQRNLSASRIPVPIFNARGSAQRDATRFQRVTKELCAQRADYDREALVLMHECHVMKSNSEYIIGEGLVEDEQDDRTADHENGRHKTSRRENSNDRRKQVTRGKIDTGVYKNKPVDHRLDLNKYTHKTSNNDRFEEMYRNEEKDDGELQSDKTKHVNNHETIIGTNKSELDQRNMHGHEDRKGLEAPTVRGSCEISRTERKENTVTDPDTASPEIKKNVRKWNRIPGPIHRARGSAQRDISRFRRIKTDLYIQRSDYNREELVPEHERHVMESNSEYILCEGLIDEDEIYVAGRDSRQRGGESRLSRDDDNKTSSRSGNSADRRLRSTETLAYKGSHGSKDKTRLPNDMASYSLRTNRSGHSRSERWERPMLSSRERLVNTGHSSDFSSETNGYTPKSNRRENSNDRRRKVVRAKIDTGLRYNKPYKRKISLYKPMDQPNKGTQARDISANTQITKEKTPRKKHIRAKIDTGLKRNKGIQESKNRTNANVIPSQASPQNGMNLPSLRHQWKNNIVPLPPIKSDGGSEFNHTPRSPQSSNSKASCSSKDSSTTNTGPSLSSRSSSVSDNAYQTSPSCVPDRMDDFNRYTALPPIRASGIPDYSPQGSISPSYSPSPPPDRSPTVSSRKLQRIRMRQYLSQSPNPISDRSTRSSSCESDKVQRTRINSPDEQDNNTTWCPVSSSPASRDDASSSRDASPQSESSSEDIVTKTQSLVRIKSIANARKAEAVRNSYAPSPLP